MYTVDENEYSTTIEASVKKIITLIVFLTFISIALSIIIVREFILIFSENNTFTYIIFGPLIFLILFLMYDLWLLLGKEKIILTNSHLIDVKSNAIFSIKRKFDIDKIKNIKIKDEEIGKLSYIESRKKIIRERRRAFPFWYRMGTIEFDYNNRTFTILSGLEEREIRSVIEIINKNLMIK